MSKTRKNNPLKGWRRISPRYHQRTVMMNKCGKKCFLGPNKSFPICEKNTCKISTKGVRAAYIRARQFRTKSSKYRTISHKANRILVSKGVNIL